MACKQNQTKIKKNIKALYCMLTKIFAKYTKFMFMLSPWPELYIYISCIVQYTVLWLLWSFQLVLFLSPQDSRHHRLTDATPVQPDAQHPKWCYKKQHLYSAPDIEKCVSGLITRLMLFMNSFFCWKYNCTTFHFLHNQMLLKCYWNEWLGRIFQEKTANKRSVYELNIVLKSISGWNEWG